MSNIVTAAIISYFDTQNAASAWLPGQDPLPVNHLNNNYRYTENRGSLQIETFIDALEYEKIAAEDRVIGPVSTNDFEQGVFGVSIKVDKGLGDKILRAQETIRDNIIHTFSGGKLATSENLFIKFGSATPREPIDEDRQIRGEKIWKKLDVFISYVYSSTN